MASKPLMNDLGNPRRRMRMEKAVIYLILLLSFSYVTSCAPPSQLTNLPVQHADQFYNINDNDYPLLHLPLIKPIEVNRQVGSSPWRLYSPYVPQVHLPDSQDNSYYAYNIEELEKFAVSNGVIMAYSAYVEEKAAPYIRSNYYHWFVIIPEKKIAEGFHTEYEFLQYIQTLGIQGPDWQTPDEAYKQFKRIGCLEWIPQCK